MQNTLINCDLSQAELRVMALLSEDEWMIGALQEGEGDFFTFHMMPAAFPKKLKQYGTMTAYHLADPVGFKEDRTKCKAVVYGLAFGRQARAIAQDIKIPVSEAQGIIDRYLGAAVSFSEWRVRVMEAAINPSKRDLLINPFGRKFQSEIITPRTSNNIQREALSFLPQSTASDICLSTGIRINKDIKGAGYVIFNIVHDALMLEGPEDGAEEIGKYVAAELRETGRMVFGDRLPFLADWSVARSWGNLS